MPSGDKPYRVYRGGRARGRFRSPAKPGAEPGRAECQPPAEPQLAALDPGRDRPHPRPDRRLGPRELLPVPRRRRRRRTSGSPRGASQVLDDQHGRATDILLLGTDHAELKGRETANRTDSITLLRVDSGKHRLAYLSIPRDLRVEIPGHGTSKINAAMQLGGPALAVKTVRVLTGLPINHVVVVDFSQFEDLIDKLGGIDDRRARADRVQVRLPVCDRGALRAVGRLALREGQAAHGRTARADLLARAEEQAEPGRHGLLARASTTRTVLQAVASKLTGLRDAGQAAVHRRRPRRADRDGHLDAGVHRARLDEVPLELREHAPLPARRRVERRRHRADRGEPRRDRDGHRRLGAAAADARIGRVRARLRDREPHARRSVGRSREAPLPPPGWGSTPNPLRRA